MKHAYQAYHPLIRSKRIVLHKRISTISISPNMSKLHTKTGAVIWNFEYSDWMNQFIPIALHYGKVSYVCEIVRFTGN